ncbi:(E2-independent) E3 ubiquitin-conjugating enzyme FATS-like [Scomber scombrus]|uniref:(E2-independent) E3 ubiquitin-conjugating enzyme FATS-like n=1 Tax=Scomber scombrus TaxID=13677 RepID=UPI002DDA6092|nr:(E2-independent) E3 ubiquitin-conjugating enzyme FATS-like [Scomber scombrus]
MTEALKEDEDKTHPATLLEFEWGPSRDLQEAHQKKRRALLQKSSRRVEEIKAKAALVKIQASSETGEQSKAKQSTSVACKSKTKSEKAQDPQRNLQTDTKSKGGKAEQTGEKTAQKSGFIKQKKSQLPPAVSDSRLKNVDEVRICQPDQRRRDVTEMHRRTQRLYEQLEEVKHQKEVRSRQEASAKNRLKAQEFHKKTLQKLRAKQTQR